MPSSIFKSICAAAAFLAFPTAAQIDNWDISYQSMETNFTQNFNNEITLDYRISTGRAFNIDLFDKGCSDPITGMTITTTPAVTAEVTADHDQLKIMLDLDKTDITSSNIWSNIKLEFCVRVQLLSDGEVIKEDERDIEIVFDFIADFEAADVAMVIPSLSPKKENGAANVDSSYISACKCDNIVSFACDTDPLGPDSLLNVCIWSIDSDVVMDVVQALQLFQGDDQNNETLSVIGDSQLQDDAISAVTKKNGTAVFVETFVPSRFFQYSGATVTVSGDVKVGFVRRRLVAIGYDVSPASKGVVSTRAMRGETISRLRYGVKNGVSQPSASPMMQPTEGSTKQPSASPSKPPILGKGVARPGYHGDDEYPTEQTTKALMTDKVSISRSSSNFEIMVGLTTEIPQAKSADPGTIEANSGTIKVVGSTHSHFPGAIVCFVWAFFW